MISAHTRSWGEVALELRSQLKATLPQHTEQIWLNECLIFIHSGRGRTREGGYGREREEETEADVEYATQL